MAAGLGFKTFTTGEVLTAADTNGYLMQGVLVFASAAARDAAITSPQEGQFAYLKDTNVTTYYTGSAWTNLDTTGMTNPMTTTGDMVYSSSGSTPARLGIGSTGQVITVAGGIPSWATPAAAASGLTKIVAGSFSAVAGVAINGCFTSTYKKYLLIVNGLLDSTDPGEIYLQLQYSTSTVENISYFGCSDSRNESGTLTTLTTPNASKFILGKARGTARHNFTATITGVGNTSEQAGVACYGNLGNQGYNIFGGIAASARTYTGIYLSGQGNITGTYTVYGLEN